MEAYKDILAKYRNYWAKDILRDEDDHKAIFSVLHGIVERISSENYNERVAKYFNATIENLKIKRKNNQILNPETLVELIKPAFELNLPVKTPKDLENIAKIKGMFGVVHEIEDGEARISMNVWKASNKKVLWESTRVKASDLPNAYQREGVWVSWIEYQFKDGKEAIGNFEPASTHPDIP